MQRSGPTVSESKGNKHTLKKTFWGSDPKSPLPVGRFRPLSNKVLLGTVQVSLPNGISFRPTTLAGRTSFIDDIQKDRPRYANICPCRHRRNCFQRCRLKFHIFHIFIQKM